MIVADAVKKTATTREATKRDVEIALQKWFGNKRDRKDGDRTKQRMQSFEGSADTRVSTGSVTTPRRSPRHAALCMGTPPEKVPRFSL